MLVGPHDDRRPAEAAGRRRHEPGARGVGVHDVGAHPADEPHERQGGDGELRQAHGGADRVQAQAGLERGDVEAPDAGPVHGGGQRAARRAGDHDLVLVAQRRHQAQERDLGPAPGARVVDEEDPHGAPPGRPGASMRSAR